MQYITDVREAKEIDRMTIQEIGIPSMVLMEKEEQCRTGKPCAGSLWNGK